MKVQCSGSGSVPELAADGLPLPVAWHWSSAPSWSPGDELAEWLQSGLAVLPGDWCAEAVQHCGKWS